MPAQVVGVIVPRPHPGLADNVAGRVYVRFADTEAARKCREMMDNRTFDGAAPHLSPHLSSYG